MLAGPERIAAQKGLRPLEQAEAIGSLTLRQSRSLEDPDANWQILLGEEERTLIERIETSSLRLSDVTTRGRGDEMSASGAFWRCGSCNSLTVPGTKRKGGGFNEKRCPNCSARLAEDNIEVVHLVSPEKREAFVHPYIDGEALDRRYQNPARKYLRTDMNTHPPLKDEALYRGERILIRQAGVGITATLVEDGSRVPQSVYLYWAAPNQPEQGYTNAYLLGVLSSRVMNYYHMKLTGEVDPARAFAKVTHDRLGALPVPRLDSSEKVDLANKISSHVREMLAHPHYGGEADWKIENLVRQLWGITGDEGRYINGFFSLIPDGQARRDLFPDDPPSRVPYPAD